MAKKNFKKGRTMKELKAYVAEDEDISIRHQCEMLGINRSSLYYEAAPESEENLELMRRMDEHFLDHPTHGVLQMQDYLFLSGFLANPKRIRRLLRKMGVMALYPKRNLSKLGKAEYIRPYLLRNLEIDKPNQVWAIDITYVPMHKGFMYLTAIIDLHSRYVVGWGLSNSLEAAASLDVLKEAISRHGKPEIINSDQGSQFTCALWIDCLTEQGILISMDGKGRALDNIFIERLWRTVKQDYVYLHPALDGKELHTGLKAFFHYYNASKPHQGIGRVTPLMMFTNAA